MRLRVGHQHSQFEPILVCFVDYYSRFRVPERFPRLTIPRVPLRVRRQTLIVLAHFDQLPGLLLTVLGSQNDFHD